jgi:hypothetical protein
MRGIAHQRNPAERPLLDRIAIFVRIDDEVIVDADLADWL